MYTLHYSPGSCALVIHALLEEFGVPFEVKRVDAASKDEYRRTVVAKGKVPALVTPDGVLTECVALVEYLCDRHGDGKLPGKPGTWERARERMVARPSFARAMQREGIKAFGTT